MTPVDIVGAGLAVATRTQIGRRHGAGATNVSSATLTRTDTLCHYRSMVQLIPDLTMVDALPDSPFTELHQRTVEAPVTLVWPQCLAVTAREIRLLG